MMVSVWFNDNYGYKQAMLLSFAYLLQFSAFVLYTIALTLTIEEALNKLQYLETRLKTLLGKITSLFGGIFRVFLKLNHRCPLPLS